MFTQFASDLNVAINYNHAALLVLVATAHFLFRYIEVKQVVPQHIRPTDFFHDTGCYTTSVKAALVLSNVYIHTYLIQAGQSSHQLGPQIRL